ncbi:hypothetical protein K443DRAFT_679604 [Laccaria amethystina LaAM-08-1]|uniref:Uncharacterized protein n=1 Tax=Laccaria amethystina LaAM-08-1 TaxID=1095629 RepID=A0A0C9XE88_9AGAR|nr:hypothetical protein K443DRAFT_679604 [Laccaria amethystina LaAM-08-1]
MPTKSITEVVGLVNGVVAPFQLSPQTQLQSVTGTAFRVPPAADELPAPPEFRPRGPPKKPAMGDSNNDKDKDKKDKPKGPPGGRG